MAEGDRAPRWLGPAALFVFALSGCSGLIYQSIWSKYLGLYLGHAAYAQSLVLAIFMGGMAIGAWWASTRSIGWRNLLRAYAIIELVIGVAGALFHPIYGGLTGFAYDTAFPNLPGGWAVQAFKWGSGALLILPQSILLGMTFPLMSSGLMRRLRVGDGAILGGLYFTNSIGAAFGALFATFVLLPAIGLPGAMRFGAILNIVVALAAFLLSREDEQPHAPAATRAEGRTGFARLLLVAAFVTGATSFVYEIGWVRMLSLVFGSTVHAFELMLAAFIGGLAFGGLWIRGRIDGYASPLRVGGWVQILMGLAALASLIVYDRAFDWVAWFLRALSRTDGGYDLYNIVTASVSILMMAPAAFFAGMTLPLFTLALIRNGGGEASVGRIYAANTIGAIVGVFAAVHLLIPVLGLKLAMIVAAAGDLVLGLVLLRRVGNAGRRVDMPYLGGLAICGLALVVTLIAAKFDPRAMAGGVYRTAIARLHEEGGTKVMFYRDGKTASVAVRESANAVRSIATNGKVDAGIRMAADGKPGPDEITMVMAGVVSSAHHPNPKTAAVIGFGSGLTTHTLLGDARLERVDTIEIEPAMIEGARLFGSHVERAYKDPRSKFHIEDARTFFAANRARYDIIVSEPSNPWVSGVASLFSTEFYEFIPRHLAPGGLFVQWIQLYEINDELVGTVVNALSKRFVDYRVYLAYNNDMLIVARADGPVGDLDGSVLDTPALKPELTRLGISSIPELVAHQLGDRRSMEPFFATLSSRTNSDYHPILSLEAPKARFTSQIAASIVHLTAADLPYREVLAEIPVPSPQEIAPSLSYEYSTTLHHVARLAEALRSGTDIDAIGLDGAAVAYLRAAVGQCAGGPDPTNMVDAVVNLAGRSLPYMQPRARVGVWIDPQWVTCDSQPEQVRLLLETVAALARGEGAAVIEGARSLLRDPELTSVVARDWLLRAALLAAVQTRDPNAQESLLVEFGSAPVRDMRHALYRQWSARLGKALQSASN